MSDEVLRWVNKHFSNFGGDYNQLTIAGKSAGATSATVLLLAPQTQGNYIILLLFCNSIPSILLGK